MATLDSQWPLEELGDSYTPIFKKLSENRKLKKQHNILNSTFETHFTAI